MKKTVSQVLIPVLPIPERQTGSVETLLHTPEFKTFTALHYPTLLPVLEFLEDVIAIRSKAYTAVQKNHKELIDKAKRQLSKSAQGAVIDALREVRTGSLDSLYVLLRDMLRPAVLAFHESRQSSDIPTERGIFPAELPVNAASIPEILPSEILISPRKGPDTATSSNQLMKGFWCGTKVSVSKLKSLSHRDVEALASLRHPSIVQILGVTSLRGRQFLVTERVDATLDQLLATTSLSFKKRVRIALEIAQGMAYMHSGNKHTCVHGSLSLSNVMTTTSSEVKVFNMMAPVSLPWDSNDERPPPLMHVAPEILKNADPSPASDVYAFGTCILFAMFGMSLTSKMENRVADLIAQCVRFHPEQRPTFPFIVAYLERLLKKLDAQMQSRSHMWELRHNKDVLASSNLPSDDTLVDQAYEIINRAINLVNMTPTPSSTLEDSFDMPCDGPDLDYATKSASVSKKSSTHLLPMGAKRALSECTLSNKVKKKGGDKVKENLDAGGHIHAAAVGGGGPAEVSPPESVSPHQHLLRQLSEHVRTTTHTSDGLCTGCHGKLAALNLPFLKTVLTWATQDRNGIFLPRDLMGEGDIINSPTRCDLGLGRRARRFSDPQSPQHVDSGAAINRPPQLPRNNSYNEAPASLPTEFIEGVTRVKNWLLTSFSRLTPGDNLRTPAHTPRSTHRLSITSDDPIVQHVMEHVMSHLKVVPGLKSFPSSRGPELNIKKTFTNTTSISDHLFASRHMRSSGIAPSVVASSAVARSLSLESLEKVGQHSPVNTIGDILKTFGNWDFDVFLLNHFTQGFPLSAALSHVISHFGLMTKLSLNMEKFARFCFELETMYKSNPYHNSIHAADIVQTLHYFLCKSNARDNYSDVEVLGLYIAAAAHDVDHDGLNNSFHVRTMSPKALAFNDVSPLENHHIVTLFRLLLAPATSFCEGLSRESLASMRAIIVASILGTDMSLHFEIIQKFKSSLGQQRHSGGARNPDRLLIAKLLLHVADISNPSKPGTLALRWTYRLMDEYGKIGDQERNLNMAISPLCDRFNRSISASQIGFIEFIVLPSLKSLAEVMPTAMDLPLSTLEVNLKYWRQMLEEEQREKERLEASRGAGRHSTDTETDTEKGREEEEQRRPVGESDKLHLSAAVLSRAKEARTNEEQRLMSI